MGLKIGNIVPRREIGFDELKGKIIAVDAFNAIYQFLTSIRQPDGTPLMDFKGNVTSHLSGLFYRNMALLEAGLKFIYVFDGEYHVLKGRTHEKRQEAKDKAKEEYMKAVEEEDIYKMGKYSRGFVRLNSEMINESKELLEAMGIAVVQASSEGEMQCSELVKSGQAWAVGSQDYDALVVGGKRLIQNLTLSRKRKTSSGEIYIAPEIIEYEKTLQTLEIDSEQFISLAILVGSDFNPGGVKGIGPKKALVLVKEKKYPALIFKELEEQGRLDFNWKDVFEIFKRPNVHKEKVIFPKLNEEKIVELLINRRDFSKERIEKHIGKLRDLREQ